METLKKLRILNSNALKLLAAVAMFIDHFGLLYFPEVLVLRYIGRLAMPLFAFAISEGCRYTRDKRKHFLFLFAVGLACQLVYFIFFDWFYLFFSTVSTNFVHVFYCKLI